MTARIDTAWKCSAVLGDCGLRMRAVQSRVSSCEVPPGCRTEAEAMLMDSTVVEMKSLIEEIERLAIRLQRLEESGAMR